MTYTFPPINVNEYSSFVRGVEVFSASQTLTPANVTTYWNCATDLTCTLFSASQAKYPYTFHRYRIVNAGPANLRVVAPENFWNDGISTVTILPKHAITVSAVRINGTSFWAVLGDVELAVEIGPSTSQTVVSSPFIVTLGSITKDLSEGTITKNATEILIGTSGDYSFIAQGDVVDTGSSSLKVSYLNMKINRGGTILSRASFSVLTRGGGATYSIILPSQKMILVAGDKLYMEFDPNSQLTGTIKQQYVSIVRTIYGVG